MDYKNKYEAAIKYLKAFIDGDCVTDSEILADFPELAESEDERIRKNCIHFLELQKQHHAATFEIEECIAWLEKQKEQKPSCGCVNVESEYDKGWRAGHKAGLKDAGQKPAEWSEEDVDAITTAIRACRYITENFENSTKQYEDAIEKLKSLRPQYHGDVTMTEAYKMGLEAGKASHWKPSEEKLSALGSYVEELQARATAAVGGWNKFDALIDLYNDLKKL